MKNVLISIITPTYNRVYCIKRAINSVKSLKIPKGFDYEHIIVDDGSTDSTQKVVRKTSHKKLRYFKLKKNKGVNASRNKGMGKARGDYFLFFDSDDELLDDALVKVASALRKTKYRFMVYKFKTQHYRTKKDMSRIVEPWEPITYREKLEGKRIRGELISLISRKVYEKIKFDERRFAFESIFWNKVSKMFESEIAVNKVIRIYHDENKDRLCKKLLEPKYSEKRIKDYEFYIKEFKDDLLKFGLKEKLADSYFKTGFYCILSGKMMGKGRSYLREALKIRFSLKYACLLALSYLGSLPVRLLGSLYKAFA